MRAAIFLLVLALLGACTSSAPVAQSDAEQPEVSEQPSPEATETEVAGEEIVTGDDFPKGPVAFAEAFVETTRTLKATIDQWQSEGSGRGLATRLAIRQQKMFQELAGRPPFAERVIDALPPGLARFVGETATAGQRLRRLVSPLEDLPDWKTYHPAPPNALRRYYEAGQRRFDVPWYVLASLNFVESRFGRILGPSSAGALGPMQFMPATWDAYGGGGDVMDPRDSIIGAARYLSASGAPERMRDALYAYNHSYDYVHAIQVYARHMKRDVRNFYAYYLYQVFVLTTEGNVQLTGPGGVRPAGGA